MKNIIEIIINHKGTRMVKDGEDKHGLQTTHLKKIRQLFSNQSAPYTRVSKVTLICYGFPIRIKTRTNRDSLTSSRIVFTTGRSSLPVRDVCCDYSLMFLRDRCVSIVSRCARFVKIIHVLISSSEHHGQALLPNVTDVRNLIIV